ncbi:hypothetical protein AVEN_249863-1 [Araneus ventricosus]|uniref:Reverse transcriptase/retrotransposon-derived protein RNase H-like domain-containing protein n=1 Tax=Araneus ventricosus TaxID=182803 RepID=A0A4Y2PGU9_ARAVE|nr:hypothetical protein AVEN_249863-1 [Araneus ventricosus]
MPETKPEVSLSVEQDSQLLRIAFKAPVFWENDPELWFFQVELQFVIAADALLPLMTDASDFAVGAVLQQHIESTVEPLGFFSRKHFRYML